MTSRPVPDEPRGRSWRDKAACLDHPAEWFTDPAPGDTRRAIGVCNSCPVKQPCLDTALTIEPSADLGIWGGTTPTSRQRLRRQHYGRPAEICAERDTFAKLAPVDRPATQTGRLELFEDEHGDHIDRTGRVIVFEIQGDPPYMLMIDRRPRARAQTVDEAADLAARLLTRPTDMRTHERAPNDGARLYR